MTLLRMLTEYWKVGSLPKQKMKSVNKVWYPWWASFSLGEMVYGKAMEYTLCSNYSYLIWKSKLTGGEIGLLGRSSRTCGQVFSLLGRLRSHQMWWLCTEGLCPIPRGMAPICPSLKTSILAFLWEAVAHIWGKVKPIMVGLCSSLELDDQVHTLLFI